MVLADKCRVSNHRSCPFVIDCNLCNCMLIFSSKIFQCVDKLSQDDLRKLRKATYCVYYVLPSLKGLLGIPLNRVFTGFTIWGACYRAHSIFLCIVWNAGKACLFFTAIMRLNFQCIRNERLRLLCSRASFMSSVHSCLVAFNAFLLW